jgi:hypothetical protein
MRICWPDVVPRAIVFGYRVRIDAQHLGDQPPLGEARVNRPHIAALCLDRKREFRCDRNHNNPSNGTYSSRTVLNGAPFDRGYNLKGNNHLIGTERETPAGSTATG